MRKIERYIIEKLHIGKDMKSNINSWGDIQDKVEEYLDKKYGCTNIEAGKDGRGKKLIFTIDRYLSRDMASRECYHISKLINVDTTHKMYDVTYSSDDKYKYKYESVNAFIVRPSR